MKISVWMIISENGAVVTRKNKPPLGVGEIAFQLNMDVPASLFVRPIIRAEVKLPEGAPLDLQADIFHNIEDAVLKATDLEVAVTLAPYSEHDDS